MAGADGGVFNFGDSQALPGGSLGDSPRSAANAIVGIAGTPTGMGYWLAGRDAGVYAFGDAPTLANPPGVTPSTPIVGIAGYGRDGYWLLGEDGGIFAYGTARVLGSLANRTLTAKPVAIASTPGPTAGFRVALADGAVYAFSNSAGPVVDSGSSQSSSTPALPPAAVAGEKPPAGIRRLSRWPSVELRAAYAKRNGRSHLRQIDFIAVSNIVRGATVRLLCSSGRQRCPFARSTTRTVERRGLVRFRARPALGRATVTVLVTKPGLLGAFTSWRLRRGESLSQVDKNRKRACVLHGSSRPIACR